MKHSHLFLIGLTGGIACGKSTILAMLAALGARTIDADRITHRVQQPGMPVYQQIVAAFGPSILTAPNGPIDRGKLGALVFSDANALQKLESIVHPAVRSEIRNWLDQVAGGSGHGTRLQPLARPVAVIDAIKLLESSWANDCDQVWIVICTPEQQVERLKTTRGMREEEARQRIAAQPPQESRLSRADVVIDNSGSLDDTRAQVEAAWAEAVTQL